MSEKIKVFHFHNGKPGGVFSVIRNLLKYSNNPVIENYVIYTINKKTSTHFDLFGLEGATSEQVFYYSRTWNFYHTCRELSKLLPAKALIVAHDWLELGMVSNMGIQNPVVQLLHGNYDYYYKLAELHQEGIDKFICISKPIFNTLCRQLPGRAADISCNYVPVPEIKKIDKDNVSFNIYYGVGDLEDHNKQFEVIIEIDRKLRSKDIHVSWTIVGNYSENSTKQKLEGLQNHRHYSHLKNEEVLKLLETQHLFILPSINEGLPVSLVEAMKAGLVPLVPKWGNAVEGLVLEAETGFYIENTDIESYVEKINELKNNHPLLTELSANAVIKANEQFDPYKNTAAIEEVFMNATKKNKEKYSKKVYGSRFDQEWLPNVITKNLRRVMP